MKKPLDELESSLKYIPIGPFFNDVFPAEIKEYILNLSCSCDPKVFIAASVCKEWKRIFKSRFNDKKVIIGEDCSKCGKDECVEVKDMMKAVATHKLDLDLVIRKPVTQVDSKLIADAFTSVSKLTVIDHDHHTERPLTLSNEQLEHLFERNKIMEEVNFVNLDLRWCNQEKLANYLSRIKKLSLDQTNFDVEKFMVKLSQDSTNIQLTHLSLYFDFHLTDFLSIGDNLVDGLCNVENIFIKIVSGDLDVSFTKSIMERLFKNILQTPAKIKTLIIAPCMVDSDGWSYEQYLFGFGSLINPQDLKTLFSKMENLSLEGIFTVEQLEAVGSLEDVQVTRSESDYGQVFHSIKKGSSDMFRNQPNQ